MRVALGLSLLLLAACGAKKSQSTDESSSSGGASASGGGASASGGGAPASGGGASPTAAGSASAGGAPAAKGTYGAAFEAFRAYAASKLGVAPEQVAGIGPNENIAKLQRGKVGQVWAFETHPKDAMTPEVRGWATVDGVVVTLEQNLGLLFAEAGVWGGGVTPPLTAQQLAEALTWAMGSGHDVFFSAPQIPAPALSVADGKGSFVFHVDHHAPGSGRGPRELSRVEVTLAAGQEATLARAPVATP